MIMEKKFMIMKTKWLSRQITIHLFIYLSIYQVQSINKIQRKNVAKSKSKPKLRSKAKTATSQLAIVRK